ncbi:Nucleotidylyl transferase [Imleria badia]|nr:Nucleotidylyl transferase [Imleria badia]
MDHHPHAAHIGYFVPLTKIANFLGAGVVVKIILAASDVHAFLNNLQAPLDLVAHRTKYYEFILSGVFTSLGIPTSKLTFKEYNLNNHKLCMIVTEVVKQVERPLLSGLIFPGYKRSKSSTSGSIFSSEVWISSMGGKMSSSDADLKINFLDTPEVVKREIKKAFCEEGNVTENGLLAFTKAVLIPTSELRLERLWGNTGEDPLQTYQELEDDFAAKKIHPGELKANFAGPIWAAFLANEEWEQIEQLAFLDPNAKKESKKKKEEVHHPLPPGKG